MSFILAFAPFIVFAALMRAVSVQFGLLGACATALLIGVRDVARGRAPKFLEAGALLLFGTLVAVSWLTDIHWTIAGVRLVVDAGLFVIVLASLALGRPFTMQIAREQVEPALWSSPLFMRVNRHITWVWAIVFALLTGADAAAEFAPQVPLTIDVAIALVALAAAIVYTRWYPARARRTAAESARSAARPESLSQAQAHDDGR